MPQAESPRTDRTGVSRLDLFFSQQGWLFREQLIHDHGIDAQVEIVSGGKATGELIAIQIKSGSSFFSERTSKGDYVFRTDSRHAEYWNRHCLPVIIVLYNPNIDLLLWEVVNDSTLSRTGRTWKIVVPALKTLTANSIDEIKGLTQPPEDIQKLNRFRLDRAWMELMDDGEIVYIEFDDYINKSLARYAVQIGCDSCDTVNEQKWPMIWGPRTTIEDALSYVIPWADVTVDEEAHREGAEDIWSAECYGGYDSEEGETYYTQSFEEWYTPPDGIVPCSNDGEAAHYRLHLTLNDLGRAFLELDDFLRLEPMLLAGAS